MAGDCRAGAAQEVADDGEVSIRVCADQRLSTPNESAEDLGVALCQQLGGLDDHASAVGRVGAPSGVAGLFQAVDDRSHATPW